jgi:hypothetical protein
MPVILFVLMLLCWMCYLAYSVLTQSPSPSYPDIRGIIILILATIISSIVGFILSACGFFSSSVPRRLALTGLALNAMPALYVFGYYAVLAYSLLITQ